MEETKKRRIEVNRLAAVAKLEQRQGLKKRHCEEAVLVPARKRALGLFYGATMTEEAVDWSLGSCLNGGAISEVHGEAGTGKSILAATVAAYGLRASRRGVVLFVETKGPHTHLKCVSVASSFLPAHDVKARVMSTSALDVERFLAICARDVPHVNAKTAKVALVVVDSIADLMRQGNDKQERQDNRRRILKAIKACSKNNNIPFFLVNQVVSTSFGEGGKRGRVVAANDDLMTEFTTRFLLTRRHDNDTILRRIVVTTAPDDENGDSSACANFEITNAGVRPLTSSYDGTETT